jgi:hypothetical protein
VAEVEVGECVEDECGGVGCVRDGAVGETIFTRFTEIDLCGIIFEFSKAIFGNVFIRITFGALR